MSEQRAVCLYHKNCMDGRASCAIVQRKEGRIRRIGMQYGLKRPKGLLSRKVYLVDFAFDEAGMREIAGEAAPFIWLDHHETSVDLAKRLGWGLVDVTECGATLAWRFCFPQEPMPPILEYIKDRDLWRWIMPDSRAINLGLDLLFEEVGFEGFLDLDLDRVRTVGEPAWRQLQKRVDLAVRHGVAVKEPYGLRGVTAMVVNSNRDISDIGERIYQSVADGGQGMDLAIIFFLRADGKWIHALRSEKIDCERIAANRGGGGHKCAASYVAPMPFPFSDDCLDWPG